jgi:sialate O-acetylesterase
MTLSLPNTGMAVTTDIGNAKDIHPRNKQDVGKRLALVALHHTYGKNVVFSGPVYQSMKVAGKEVSVSFIHDEGLRTRGQADMLVGFEIAGEDQKFYRANARILGRHVILTAKEVAVPVAVRYAWADDAGAANLFNQSGLPAVPFRTDNWPGITLQGKYRIAGR